MLSRTSAPHTTFGAVFDATDVFAAAVWVLRTVAIIATLFVATVVTSWLT